MKLAYSKFKSTPLYLEWAPENTFKTPPDVSDKNNTKHVNDNKIQNDEKNEGKIEESDESESDFEPEEDTTLYVKNISFETTDEMIKKVNIFVNDLKVYNRELSFIL